MKSSGWPFPTVVAGSFRTTLAKAAGRDFDEKTQGELLATDVAGVLPLAGGQLYFPAPHDCVLGENAKVHRAKPSTTEPGESDGGANWPTRGLRPVLLEQDEDFKPETGPTFWPVTRLAEWLTGGTVRPLCDFLAAPESDERDHVSLNPETGAAADGLLFTTTGIGSRAIPRFGCTPRPIRPTGSTRQECYLAVELSARVENLPAWGQDAAKSLSTWHSLGGERRLVHWVAKDDATAWRCPDVVRNKLNGKPPRVTMTLATPAFFEDGWKPSWLDNALTGSPWKNGPKLQLVGVCTQRWKAVSGWSYKDGGPKAIRRVVPAGGVYFFEMIDRDRAGELADLWLRTVSDGEQERRDGFGLAVWGTW